MGPNRLADDLGIHLARVSYRIAHGSLSVIDANTDLIDDTVAHTHTEKARRYEMHLDWRVVQLDPLLVQVLAHCDVPDAGRPVSRSVARSDNQSDGATKGTGECPSHANRLVSSKLPHDLTTWFTAQAGSSPAFCR